MSPGKENMKEEGVSGEGAVEAQPCHARVSLEMGGCDAEAHSRTESRTLFPAQVKHLSVIKSSI